MNKAEIQQLLRRASELDRSGRYAEADAIGNRIIKSESVDAPSYDEPGDAAQSATQTDPNTGQTAPKGYEYSPDGHLQPMGTGRDYAAQQYTQSLGPAGTATNPFNGDKAPAGFEYSPKGFLQPSGHGTQYQQQQVKTQFPGYTPPAAAPAVPAANGAAAGGNGAAAGGNETQKIQQIYSRAIQTHKTTGNGWSVINKALPSLSPAGQTSLKREFAAMAQQMLSKHQ